MQPFRSLLRRHIGRAISCYGECGQGRPLLQTPAEFSSVAIRKAGIRVDEVRMTIDAWRAVLPVQGTEDDDLSAALDGMKKNTGWGSGPRHNGPAFVIWSPQNVYGVVRRRGEKLSLASPQGSAASFGPRDLGSARTPAAPRR
jgi:hypothetical protein